MQKKDRREFLKKLIVGTGAVVATTAVAKNTQKSQKNEDVLYKRSKNWEFYYKQAN